MTTILLIDLSSIAHPLWHVSASEPDPNATSTKTVERVRALASGQPFVAICCDSGRSFRKDVSADYKANRPESDAALQHQIMLAMETLREDGFPVWAVKGFEADDLIATACHEALLSDKGRIVVASSDKDLLQLVNDRVTVKSLTNGNEYDEAAVVAKFGVRPNQMRDWLSLVGDASDNVQGAKGIGPKNTTALLTKYGNLEDLYSDLHTHGTNFTPALSTALREFEARMPKVRELITLRTDVPLPFDEVFRERVPTDTAVFGDEEPMHKTHSPDGDGQAIIEVPVSVVEKDNGQNPRAIRNNDQNYSPVPDEKRSGGRVEQTGVGSEPTVSHSFVAPVDFERQLEPRSYAEAKALAGDLFVSRMFSAYGNAPAVLSTILAGRELGLQASASLRGIHVVEGKHMLAADLIRALIIRSGQAKYFRCTERTAEKATFKTERKDDATPMELSYTIEEARIAGLVKPKSGWEKNPADMLTARASSKLARLVYPDIVFGLYAPEEMD